MGSNPASPTINKLLSIGYSLVFVNNDCRSSQLAIRVDIASTACVTEHEVDKLVLVFEVRLVFSPLMIFLLRKRR